MGALAVVLVGAGVGRCAELRAATRAVAVILVVGNPAAVLRAVVVVGAATGVLEWRPRGPTARDRRNPGPARPASSTAPSSAKANAAHSTVTARHASPARRPCLRPWSKLLRQPNQIAGLGLPVSDCRSRIAGLGLPVSDCRSRIAGHRPPPPHATRSSHPQGGPGPGHRIATKRRRPSA